MFTKPDYNKCVLNVSSTLAEFLNVKTLNATLPILKEKLKNNYKNVVFICFDGMGVHPLTVNAPKDGFLWKHVVDTLTSTFPSTTTNATTSLNTDKLPLEHGWFGWFVYFDQLKRSVELFTARDYFTREKVNFDLLPPSNDYYFDKADSEYKITSIMPPFCKKSKFNGIVSETISELFDNLTIELSKPYKQFIYCYNPYPDSTMHDFGVTSDEAKADITQIAQGLEKLKNNFTDTLIIVTADHGQIDVAGEIELYKDTELTDMLKAPAFLEARAPAFWVKEERKSEFERLFNERYGKDFVLYKTQTLIEENYFGSRGEFGYLLGDYIAIGTDTNKIVSIKEPDGPIFKGHHTSLTKEMTVPLILIECGKN